MGVPQIVELLPSKAPMTRIPALRIFPERGQEL